MIKKKFSFVLFIVFIFLSSCSIGTYDELVIPSWLIGSYDLFSSDGVSTDYDMSISERSIIITSPADPQYRNDITENYRNNGGTCTLTENALYLRFGTNQISFTKETSGELRYYNDTITGSYYILRNQ